MTKIVKFESAFVSNKKYWTYFTKLYLTIFKDYYISRHHIVCINKIVFNLQKNICIPLQIQLA